MHWVDGLIPTRVWHHCLGLSRDDWPNGDQDRGRVSLWLLWIPVAESYQSCPNHPEKTVNEKLILTSLTSSGYCPTHNRFSWNLWIWFMRSEQLEPETIDMFWLNHGCQTWVVGSDLKQDMRRNGHVERLYINLVTSKDQKQSGNFA